MTEFRKLLRKMISDKLAVNHHLTCLYFHKSELTAIILQDVHSSQHLVPLSISPTLQLETRAKLPSEEGTARRKRGHAAHAAWLTYSVARAGNCKRL